MTLSCDLHSSCARGVWAFLYNTSHAIYLTSQSSSASDESFSVSDVIKGDMMTSSLHIYNLTESLAGIYDCNCQNFNNNVYHATVRILTIMCMVSCFNVAVLSCQLKFKRTHETLKVTLNNN